MNRRPLCPGTRSTASFPSRVRCATRGFPHVHLAQDGGNFDLCDDVTIMRDGAYVSTRDLKGTTKAQLVRDMVGRNVDQLFPKLGRADR